MNCDRAGELLGMYLRDELLPSTRAEIQAHLDRCAICRADLDDYQLVFDLPRVEPSEALHDRIFASPEFREIARAVSLHHASMEDEAPLAGHASGADGSLPGEGKPGTNGHTPHLMILRPNGQVAHAGSNGHRHVPRPAAPPARRIDWQRMALRLAAVAAVLVLILGSALAVKTLLRPQPGMTAIPTFDLGAPVPGPLAAGNRVVYLHNGRLWSAPEQGPQLRAPLTDKQVTVAPGWAVAPAAGPDGIHHLAYIDMKTGTLHFIQTDDGRDQVVARVAPAKANLPAFWQSAEGKAILAGLSWSPDARQLAFVADSDGSGAALWMVNADGSVTRSVSGAASAGALLLLPAWSSDSSHLAYVWAKNGASSIWDYMLSDQSVSMVEQQAAPEGEAGHVVQGLFWTGDTLNPTLTWSEGAPGTSLVEGLWSYRLNQTPHLARLTPNGETFSAVDYNSLAGGSGAWLVGQVGVGLRSVYADGSAVNGLASGHIVAARWSPDGSSAFYLTAEANPSTGTLWVWTPVFGQRQIAENVALAPLPVWSPDTQHILYLAGNHALSATVDGHSKSLAGVGMVYAFAWAPDNARVAFAGPAGIFVTNPDGSAFSQEDNASGVSVLAWTAVP